MVNVAITDFFIFMVSLLIKYMIGKIKFKTMIGNATKLSVIAKKSGTTKGKTIKANIKKDTSKKIANTPNVIKYADEITRLTIANVKRIGL